MGKNSKNISFSSGKIHAFQKVVWKEPVEKIENIIFIHPPKVGGTNLVSLAEALEKVGADVHPKRFAVPRVEGVSPNRIVEGWQGGMKKLSHEYEIARQTFQDDALARESLAKGKNFISGHFPFGAHEYLSGDFRYVMMVREPISRAISAVRFDIQRDYVPIENASDYVKSALDNIYTRLLAGPQAMSGECTEETYNKAIENLDNYVALCAPSEETDAFIEVLASMQEWGPIAMARQQITSENVQVSLSDELINELKVRNSFDIRLYELIKARWNALKEKYVSAWEAYGQDALYLTLTPDFLSHKTPEWMAWEEIEAHNAKAPDVVEVQQKHAGLPQESILMPQPTPCDSEIKSTFEREL